MEPIIEDNGDGDLIATKINNLNEFIQIMETDTEISAGAVTSIPVTTLTQSLLPTGYAVTLVDKATGEQHELTLADAAESGDTALTIVSYTFDSDIIAGSAIYFKYTDLLNYLFFAP